MSNDRSPRDDAVPSDAAEGRVLWVVGAGSGVGRATAVAAAAAGWSLVLSGRRVDALEQTRSLLGEAAASARILPLDVRDHGAVAQAVGSIDRLDALVIAAGANTKRRRFDDQDSDEFDDVVTINLLAPARLITAALPQLRASGSAHVVLVSSQAAWTPSPGAGVAYSASKTALSTIARDLNAQEAASGVRACHLCPGSIDSDFLRARPTMPSDEERATLLTPADVARSILFVLDSPPHVRIDELVLSPLSQIGGY
ncbi:SDR family oxidoreductase [Herbiconiux sp. L3-i23]|uniref:SDR family oxidoreductase n=1 Tax=Herbiconiux sp. L3-i23 TaxID=2905871 RepID=UPI00205BC0B2|nr:SDR family oxidoreductase [Herbiconiux sp. L3-i23]BDI22322.1 short-chain dehydrogenase [Herbiconiux sp. L3-i23]